MSRTRHESQHLHHRRGQVPFRRNLLSELRKLFHVRQLSVEQQVSDFLKAGLLRHFVNVVAAIHQPGIGIDPADRRFARDHARQAWAVRRLLRFGNHVAC